MNPTKQSVRNSMLAVGAILIALIARLLLDPLLGDQFPYLTFFVAIAVSALYGGLWPSVLAVVLSGLAANWFFMPPRHTLGLTDTAHLVGLVIYITLGLALVGFGQALQRSKRQAEIALESLQESEERLRLAAEGAKLGLWFWELKKNELIWTGRCKEMFGLPPDAVVTYERFLECLHPDDRERTHAAVLQSHREGTPYDMEYRVRWPDGTVHWIAAKGHSLFDERGTLARMHGIVLDIDAHVRARETIAESEARFRTLADHMSQLAWMADADGSINWYNQRWYDYTGTTFENMQGWGWQTVHHPDEVERVAAKWTRALLTGETWEDTFPLRSREGEYRWFLSRAVPIRDAQGTVVRWFGTNTDVTEQRNAEAALRESEERFRALAGRLEQVVTERTGELVHSQERLRALATELNLTEQRERKRLATDLHDHLAQLLVLARLKLSQAKRLPDVGAGGQSLILETEKVLDQSLTYTRTLVAELAPPILHDVGLAAALKWLGQHMEDRGLKVSVQIADGLPTLPEEHAVLLFQSVRELLMNTWKHAEADHAVVSFAQQHGDLLLEVRDAGKGIDVPALAVASATPNAGSKFGLFSIRERMRSLGGRCDLESAPGQGTRATLVLPLRVADDHVAGSMRMGSAETTLRETVSAPVRQDSGEESERIRVLLVDDHAMIRQGLRTVLDAYADLDVVGEAANGEEAVAMVERLRPALVVMDINMPRKNGIEATAEIKARFPATVVIGLSVQTNREAQDAMLKAGAAVLITKEAAVEQLYEAIRQALKESGQSCAPNPEPASL